MLLSYNNLHCNLQWPLVLPCNQSIAKQPSNLPETSQNTNGRTDINRTKIKNKYLFNVQSQHFFSRAKIPIYYVNPCHDFSYAIVIKNRYWCYFVCNKFANTYSILLASLLPFAIIIKIAITKIYHLETQLFGKQLVIVATYCQLYFPNFFYTLYQRFIALLESKVCTLCTLFLRVGVYFLMGFV